MHGIRSKIKNKLEDYSKNIITVIIGTKFEEIDKSEEIKDQLEAIRSRAAVLIGLAATPEEATQRCQAVPKIAMITSAKEYKTNNLYQLGVLVEWFHITN